MAFYPNFYSAVFGDSEPGSETIQFVEDNYAWMRDQADSAYLESEFWYAVKFSINQMTGMLRGLKEGCPSESLDTFWDSFENPTLTHLLLLNAWGDLYQITAKYFEFGKGRGVIRGNRNYHLSLGKRAARELPSFVERCSAIIKLLPNYADVVYG